MDRLSPVIQDPARRRRLYRETLLRELERIEQGKYHLRIPKLRGQWEAGSRFPIDIHETPEVFFQLSGETDFQLPHEAFTLREGEVGVIPRGMPHWEVNPDDSRPHRLMVGMFLTDCFSFHTGAYASSGKRAQSPLDRFLARDHIRISRLVNDLVEAHEETGDTRHAYTRGLFLAYVGLAIQRIETDAEPAAEPDLVRRCREKIMTDLSRPGLSVNGLARELNCSTETLYRAFHGFTGKGIIRYIHECRVERATRMLENSDLKISAIAAACGFQSPAYFHRVYLKLQGETPAKVREV
jgi:AraC-like DNA-binding protein